MHYVSLFSAPTYNWGAFASLHKLFDQSSPSTQYEKTGGDLSRPNALIKIYPDAIHHINLAFLFVVPSNLTVEFLTLLSTISFTLLLTGTKGSGFDLLLGSGDLTKWNQYDIILNSDEILVFRNIGEELHSILRKY